MLQCVLKSSICCQQSICCRQSFVYAASNLLVSKKESFSNFFILQRIKYNVGKDLDIFIIKSSLNLYVI